MSATTLTPEHFVTVPVAPDQSAFEMINVHPDGAIVSDAVLNNLHIAITDICSAAITASAAVPGATNFIAEAANDTGTIGVPFTAAGDAFIGMTMGIAMEFIFPGEDNWHVKAQIPNVMILTGAGDDTIAVCDGRNIVNAGSGITQVTLNGGSDTVIADATVASSHVTIVNFKNGDDAVLLGVNAPDYSITISDASPQSGVHIVGSNGPLTVELHIDNYSYADLGSRLLVGQSTTLYGIPFVFVHAS